METPMERATRCGASGDLWGVLGLRRSASTAETRAAARTAQFATHPDRLGDSLEATAASQWVNRAAEVLCDAAKRALLVGVSRAPATVTHLAPPLRHQMRARARSDCALSRGRWASRRSPAPATRTAIGGSLR